MLTVSVACTPLAAVKVDKQAVTFLIVGSHDMGKIADFKRSWIFGIQYVI
jgi:hypothetical protein